MTYNLFTVDGADYPDCGRPRFTRHGVWIANFGDYKRLFGFGPYVVRSVITRAFVPYIKILELNKHRGNFGKIGD